MGSSPAAPPAAGTAHERMLDLLVKLRYNPPDFLGIVADLVASLEAHSQEEEAVMRAARYRGLAAHRAEHRALAELVGHQLVEDWDRAGDYGQVLEAVDRAHQGFMDHITGLDHDLALYLVRRRQREAAARQKRRRKDPGPA